MNAAWRVLVDAGLPLAGRRAAEASEATGPPTLEGLAAAVRSLLLAEEPLGEVEREALRAWLDAWASHWPSAWREAFGGEGDAILADLARDGGDPGRHVKLRRIALAHLAGIL